MKCSNKTRLILLDSTIPIWMIFCWNINTAKHQESSQCYDCIHFRRETKLVPDILHKGNISTACGHIKHGNISYTFPYNTIHGHGISTYILVDLYIYISGTLLFTYIWLILQTYGTPSKTTWPNSPGFARSWGHKLLAVLVQSLKPWHQNLGHKGPGGTVAGNLRHPKPWDFLLGRKQRKHPGRNPRLEPVNICNGPPGSSENHRNQKHHHDFRFDSLIVVGV